MTCYSKTDFVQQRAACTTFPSAPWGPHDGFCWKSCARCLGTVRVLWCHVAIWHPPVNKQNAARGVLTHWPFFESLHTHRHTLRGAERKRIKDTWQPILAWQDWMLCPILEKLWVTAIMPFCQCEHQWFGCRSQGRIFLLWHTVWQQQTLFLFSSETQEACLQPCTFHHPPWNTSSSILGDATSCMED